MTGDEDARNISTVYEEEVADTNPVIRILAKYGYSQPLVFGAAILTTVVWRISEFIPVYLLGLTIDGLLTSEGTFSVPVVPQAWVPTGTRDQLLFVFGLFAAAAVIEIVSFFGRVLFWRWFQQKAIHELRMDAYDVTQRLGLEFFETEQTGDVMSVLNNDVNQLEDLLRMWVRDLTETAALVVGMFAIMFWLHWQLTLVTILFLPVMLVLVYFYQRAIESRYDERRSAVGALNARIENNINGIETVKSFTNESHEYSTLAEYSRSYWRADWAAAKLTALFQPGRMLLSRFATLSIVLVGAWWVLFGPPFGFTDPLSVGTVVTFYIYGRTFVLQSSRVGNLADQYTDAKASAKRVFGLIHYPASVEETDDAVSLDPVDGRVEYRDVTFRYPSAEDPALETVNFECEPGDFVGIVGPTGAGKSSVLKLLLRFYDPDEGTIAIDGTDITDVKLASLRRSIGYVSQEPFLFDGTVHENIAYNDPSTDREAIREAAKRANAHEFIAELSDGYETEVGERGVRLSGGQRQRIAIARAVLKDPDVLILDEATSHVDNQTELLIQESLNELIADRTTFAVAHRLSTVRDADRILVMQDGAVVEKGSHEELLDKDDLYATLWNVHVGRQQTVPESLKSEY